MLTACGDKNAYIPPPPPKVVVAQPLQQPVTRYIELTGNTQAINTVDLEARVQGFLEKINYVDGTLVKKDEVLFGIQRNTYEAQLEQAKATLAGNLDGPAPRFVRAARGRYGVPPPSTPRTQSTRGRRRV